ncbi:MAG TPA: hypothetical protein VE553_03245 [Candidatus Binatia bacterium]|nr:hypothetical protein [Candidatus Binatia bacterium]
MDESTTSFEALYRRASDRLVSDSSLRDALDDDQAQRLLDWGLAQVRNSAEKARKLPAAQARAAMESAVQSVRNVMQQTNRLVEQVTQGNDDMYVAVLKLVEALYELDDSTILLRDLMSLEDLARNRSDFDRQAIFSHLMSLIGGEEEE